MADVIAVQPHTGSTSADSLVKGGYRDYTTQNRRQGRMAKLYRAQHAEQTLAKVLEMKQKYGALNHAQMTVWECFEKLDTLVDESDPDTDKSQVYHAMQTAEAVRRFHPEPEYDWMVLTGFLHDLGKLLCYFGEPQHFVVGDTFPVGCAFSEKNVFSEFFELNPDSKVPEYSTECGIYKPHCGLRNVHMSFGHDEYMAHVCEENSILPPEAIYIIRFHSFYPHHQKEAYKHLMDAEDERMLPILREFQKADLYSKVDEEVDFDTLRPYYQQLLDKYFPGKVCRW
jgi:inositol oxygenase